MDLRDMKMSKAQHASKQTARSIPHAECHIKQVANKRTANNKQQQSAASVAQAASIQQQASSSSGKRNGEKQGYREPRRDNGEQ